MAVRNRREKELLAAAISDLRKLGFGVDDLEEEIEGTSHAFLLTKGDLRERVFIQTRSHEENQRYVVGLYHEYFDKVDVFVLWLESESHLYKIPVEQLSAMFQGAKELGFAGYSGRRDEQFRINIWANSHEFAAQNASERDRIYLDCRIGRPPA